jgi:hypothetical protein
VLWTYTPATLGLERSAQTTIYHCVDLLGEVPGIKSEFIDASESALARRAVTAVATSKVVAGHLTEMGFARPLLWENVADTVPIDQALRARPERRRLRAIFAGNITASKVDYTLLRRLREAGWSVALAGPLGEGGARDDGEFAHLLEIGIEYLGLLDPHRLADELVQATLGLIPYALNPYTKGVSPLKTYEYLAAGLGVVSTELPGVTPVKGSVIVARGHEGFIDAASQFAETPTATEISTRVALAQAHSWVVRGEQVRALLRDSVSAMASDLPIRRETS